MILKYIEGEGRVMKWGREGWNGYHKININIKIFY